MWSERSRFWLMLALGLAVAGGCASVPPAPANAQNSDASGDDQYEGWLFKSLTGQKTAEAPPPANTKAPGVRQVSAISDVPGGVGPLVPGPATHSDWSSSKQQFAGPPPSIPDELPPPPAGAVSINGATDESEKKGFDIADLAPENIYENVKTATGYGPDKTIAKANQTEGKALFRDKKYTEAAAKFATAAGRWPDSPLEEDALYLKGESEFFADLYPKAHDTYGGLLKKYPNTRYLDTVVAREFALGRYWEQLQDAKPSWPVTPNLTDNGRPLFDTFGYAVQAYERVRLNDPTGPLADDSLMALGSAYFRRGQFENAAYNYDQLIKGYPNSEHQAKAHMFGLQSKMRVYQGTYYIDEPLDDAQKIAERTLSQFGKQLGPERERVAQARAQIVEEKANRYFKVAGYYENRKCFGAARMYYQSILDEYPGTEKAKMAQTRLEKIRQEPDSPTNHFSWLTGLFESKKQ